MPNGLMNLALGLAMQVGSPGPSEMPNAPIPARAYGQYGFEGSGEPRMASDSQQNWLHGYHQELPAYPGHAVFRPYNYKHVLSQSQTAAGWGERPAMPYSQQFWHRYHDQATMLKTSNVQPMPAPYMLGQHSMPQQQMWVASPGGVQVPTQRNMIFVPQQSQMHVQQISQPDVLQPPVIQTTSELNQINYRR